MRTRFKLNNVIGVIIAIALMIAGVVLGFMHQRAESALERASAGTPVPAGTMAPADAGDAGSVEE